MITAVFNKFGM